ncbi:MAG: hypothetical protein KatS3mg048_1880 [Caldilinea sp.]|nr:MAG: hypothetical protein KatS3mg048_1880 [Caldilinea sp.]
MAFSGGREEFLRLSSLILILKKAGSPSGNPAYAL